MSSDTQPIRILLVEDNLVVQQYLKAALKIRPQHDVVGVVADGNQAIDEAVRLLPDIILLDLYLPGRDGIDVISHVMHHAPCPIIVISGELDRKDRDLAFEAQRAGAVSVMPKPYGMEADQFEAFSQELCHLVGLMSRVKVTRRWYKEVAERSNLLPAQSLLRIDCDLLVIGSSTGGPAALYRILESIGSQFSFSVLIAQHIAQGFGQTLCEWLAKTGCPVCIPHDGDQIKLNQVYLAPDDRHMVIDVQQRLRLIDDNSKIFTPNVDMLFHSVAKHYAGKTCALLLTGMGSDGAQGMVELYRKGVLTVAEAESSCVIFGMPKAAIEAGAVRAKLPLDEICRALKP